MSSRCEPALKAISLSRVSDSSAIDAEAVEVSERRHGSDFAIRKAILEIALAGEANISTVGELGEDCKIYLL